MTTAEQFGTTERMDGADLYELYNNGFDGTLVIAAPEPTTGGCTAWVVAQCDDGLFAEGPAGESDTLDGAPVRQAFLVPDDDTAFIAWFPYGRPTPRRY
ncbi:Uncharacterised protein [Mycobacteroides abscessus subsp. massiliense]|uniref:hypothetical protein n=1 Tax=Mycobacteroides abscessus TaxID=36809 RepID=UPI0009278234|nr:hypothetical protein [Mycobacteroides abscessus]MBN7428798.1 hypothetical protein [Mycobacteroides abscessus subsp. massiliense]SIN48886.1 Uncharacterised protein [Mycobacteroides abscessus subsp. bolletii]SKF33083.1 Uncharacterised protein [Mycobacteroides abscessus subsp. massiliense]SKF45810.1 Uncharacterised protein [Mycobacteroides abscessus subsp. massiliense]SKF47553.1 Uncharacterised protein [Mycobacteroides abscessus subsp. massiliense]